MFPFFRIAIEPRVVDEDVKNEAVDAERVVAIAERLEHRGRLVPRLAQLRERLGLHDRFSVNVRGGNRVEHVRRFVVRRAAEPKFTHRNVHIFKVQQVVAGDHRRGAFPGESAAMLVRELRHRAVEIVHDQLRDRLPHIV